MKNFKSGNDKRGGFRGNRDDRGNKGGDKSAFFGKSRGGDRSTDREVRMFKAQCSDCKKGCDVPFKPSSDKPVYCRDCFSAKRDRETKEYKAGLASGEPKMFGQGKSTTHASPVRPAFVTLEANDTMKKQIADITSKLEKLTALVENMIAEKNLNQQMSVTVEHEKETVTVSKSVVNAPVKVIVPTKKVASKVIDTKKASPKVAVKKAPATKVTVAKKVAVKKVASAKKTPVAKKSVAKVAPKKVTTKKDKIR